MKIFQAMHNGSVFYFLSGFNAGAIPLSVSTQKMHLIPFAVLLMVLCWVYAEAQRKRKAP